MKKYLIILLCFWQSQLHYIPGCRSHEITHEDIKEAMLSLVHLIRENTEKLERHEIRERHLGDQVKKSLGILSKKIIDIEEIRRHLQKFDTRVTSLERSLAKMTNMSEKVDEIYSSMMTSKHNLDFPQKHGETDFSGNYHLIESQTEMIKNLTRKLEDSQSQQHKEARSVIPGLLLALFP
ncbi:uncharacterized protein LOC123274037 isoform X2 [Cotesia glomerata]|uniref:uncharacterized protein LOC123274037 isoform X2 n=1 Tax=Cotesia glomerata TaxID=32391 RepID=UPI001D00B257|nr:uncharacterized protein LOC123274037 isoform X2 [Cotesia glomerata]